jgi:hypothetical protein
LSLGHRYTLRSDEADSAEPRSGYTPHEEAEQEARSSRVVPRFGLFVASVRTFRAAGTPIRGNRPTTEIVRLEAVSLRVCVL